MTVKKSQIRKIVGSSFITITDDEHCLEPNNITTYAPFEEPKVTKPIDNNDESLDLNILSKNERIVLAAILSFLKTDENVTIPIRREELSLKVVCSIDTVKTCIKRLEKKGAIIREKSKTGPGGWTIYAISNDVKKKMLS